MSRLKLLSCVTLALMLSAAVQCNASDLNRVLLLHSFGSDFSPFSDFGASFRRALLTKSNTPFELYEASVFATHFEDSRNDDSLVKYIRDLFSDRKIDLVVTIGAPATSFVQSHRQELFRATPMLITGIAQRRVHPDMLTANDAVLATSLDLRAFVENILRVRPSTENIVVVNGNSSQERYWQTQLQHDFESFSNRVRFTYWNELSVDEMARRAARLTPQSVILYLWVFVDATGVAQPLDRAFTRIRAAAAVPVFGSGDYQLGKGIVGGPLLPSESYGETAAKVALRILAGETPGNIKSPAIGFGPPVYDWRELQRWDISESLLPPGSIVRFREFTAWQRYRWQIIVIALTILTLTLLIASLLFERRRRRFAEAEQRRQLLEIKRMNRRSAGSVLSASLAHELKQPLAAMIANAEAAILMLKNKFTLSDSDQTVEALNDIVYDGGRAGEVIDTVRNIYRERDSEERLLHNVNNILRNVFDILRPELQGHRVTVQNELAQMLPRVSVERVQVEQVIFNLVQNAIEAMKQTTDRPRVLRVRSALDTSGDVIIDIADSGCGIDPENLDRIFEPFFTTRPDGTGMGLSISRTIVEAHGGRLTAAPDPSGGTIFRIALPSKPPSTAQTSKQSA